jgi:hypothetical protein
MASITGATAVVMLSIPGLYSIPQQLQGFAADDIFDVDQIASAETLMGVDGVLSAGFVFVPINQRITLQADSASNAIFDTWWASQQQIQDLYFANAVVYLTALGTKWNLTKGALTSYKPLPAVKKLVQPRPYTIQWQSSLPSVVI